MAGRMLEREGRRGNKEEGRRKMEDGRWEEGLER
jgi:hypothetical protein